MALGKSIRLFLIEGIPEGRWVCELSNWSGKAYKIPRTWIKKCDDRNDLFFTGIYFLLGKGDNGDDIVYIGETENILTRLKTHVANKDFWSECIVIISKDNDLNKAHIKFLESRIHSIIMDVNRYTIVNENTPTQSSLSEADESEMEEFIINSKLLISALGHKLLDPTVGSNNDNEESIFYTKTPRGADAKGKPVSDGFVVFKGSKFANTTVPSLSSLLLRKRNDLLNNEEIVKDFTFVKDYLFTSPSLAAAVIQGRHANGRLEWKNNEGITLKEIEKQQNLKPEEK